MRVLITGLNGFTGKHLKARLQSFGHEIYGLNVDLCDAEAVKYEVKRVNPEWVAHLAAMPFITHHNIHEIYNVNLLGTHNLLSALEKNAPAVKSILLASSGNIYGNSGQASSADEETMPTPANDYSVSKLSMEYMSKLWNDKLPIFIVRPFNYTGIGQNEGFVIPKIVAHFIKKAPNIELGNINVLREFNDVRFVADIYSKLLTLNPITNTINVCTGKVYSLKDVINQCTSITRHEIEIKINQNFIRPNEMPKLSGNNMKLKTLLKTWKDYSLDETLAWMLNNHD